jgi:hypothetical protein
MQYCKAWAGQRHFQLCISHRGACPNASSHNQFAACPPDFVDVSRWFADAWRVRRSVRSSAWTVLKSTEQSFL